MSISLFCFPYAGAGASAYRPLASRPSAMFRVETVQYPGREERFQEPMYGSLAEAALDCMRQVLGSAGDETFAFFGHSFGALVAYQTAQLLREVGETLPVHLIMSGAAGPGVPREDTGAELADDDELVRRVVELSGRLPEAFYNRELRSLLLLPFRADIALHERHVPGVFDPLPVPVTTLLGARDRLVTPRQALQWAETTSMTHRLTLLPGGHMYLSDDWQRTQATVEQTLADSSTRPRHPAGSWGDQIRKMK